MLICCCIDDFNAGRLVAPPVMSTTWPFKISARKGDSALCTLIAAGRFVLASLRTRWRFANPAAAYGHACTAHGTACGSLAAKQARRSALLHGWLYGVASWRSGWMGTDTQAPIFLG